MSDPPEDREAPGEADDVSGSGSGSGAAPVKTAPVREEAASTKAAAPTSGRRRLPPRAGPEGPVRKGGARGRRRRSSRRRAFERALRARHGRSLSKFLANTPLLLGSVLLLFFVVVGLLAPLAYPTGPNTVPSDPSVFGSCAVPSAPTLQLDPFQMGAHPFGETDHLGLDVLRGLLLGTRWDLLLLAVIVGVSAILGAVLGAMAGAMGGWTESLLAPLFDSVLAFPPFMVLAVVLALTLNAVASPLRFEAFVVVMLAVLWAPFAQAVRAQARLVARQPFVEAARATGARWSRVLLRHVVPNCNASILAQVPPTVFSVLALLGSYQYIGLFANGQPRCGKDAHAGGTFLIVPSPHFPEWTWTLANGATGWFPPGAGPNEWWGYMVPVAWIALFVLAVTLACDGLVSFLSPYQRTQ